MVSFRDLVSGLRLLNLDQQTPVIVHTSLSSFGELRGGSEILVGALLSMYDSVMMPVFTYKTMLIPETGPAQNGLEYGSGLEQNRVAEFYQPDMPADILMGTAAETLRHHARAERSMHPILSFCGVGVTAALKMQSLASPLEPIRVLRDQGGWVLLAGVNHTANTSLHLAEALAGREGFTRWALTPKGVQECPQFPGCSAGFEKLAPQLTEMTRTTQIGTAKIQALPLQELIETARRVVEADPLALLCDQPHCERCNTVRERVLNES